MVTRLERAMRRVNESFIGVDGEGITVDGVHHYVMLTAAKEDGASRTITDMNGLSTEQCFEFFMDLKRDWPGVIVGFSFGYDVNMILRDMHKLDILQLASVNVAIFKGKRHCYQIRALPGKWTDIRQGTWSRGKFEGTRGKSVRIFDVFGFFQKSFVRSLREWSIEGDIDAIESMKEQRGVFNEGQLEDIKGYNIQECVLLTQLVKRLSNCFRDAGIPLRSYHGAGAGGAALMMKHGIKDYVQEHPPQLDDMIMRAYFGGRIQCIRQGIINKPVYAHDINSAYPYAMKFLPVLWGGWRYVTEYEPTPYGLWHISWELDQTIPLGPFPYRHKSGVHYPYKGEGWYWSPEVDVAIRHFKLNVIEGWIFEPSEDIKPFSFVDEVYHEREQYKRTGDRRHVALKLAANSMYGKTVQSVGFRDDRPPYQSYIWGGLITSWCRAKLLDLCMRDPESVITVATDGVLADRQLTEHEGTSFGGWEVTNYAKAFTFGPGRYYLTSASGVVTTRTRGFMVRELPYERVFTAWVDRRWMARLPIVVTRFIGYKTAVHRKDWSKWRSWITEHRELKASQFSRGHPSSDSDIEVRWASWGFDGLSKRYSRNDHKVIQQQDDEDSEQG